MIVLKKILKNEGNAINTTTKAAISPDAKPNILGKKKIRVVVMITQKLNSAGPRTETDILKVPNMTDFKSMFISNNKYNKAKMSGRAVSVIFEKYIPTHTAQTVTVSSIWSR